MDVRMMLPDGTVRRERKRAPVSGRSAALRWGQERERELFADRHPQSRKEVPTLGRFVPRFLQEYAEANRSKPSGIASKESILRVHLVPALGRKRLDTITSEDVQRLKVRLRDKAPKTVNNVLTVLSTVFTTAVEWSVIDQSPCTVRLLKVPRFEASFHDFAAYDRLVASAREVHDNALLVVLLGGEAGLRCGEMMALEWSDVDWSTGQLTIQRSDWKGRVTASKGGRVRHVRLTARLRGALQQHRHLRGTRVLVGRMGQPLTQKMVQNLVKWASRKAGVPSGVHILRHTFCSHLAMLGAPTSAVQQLAGHQHLSTTQRYMHLSPAALEGSIGLLDQRRAVPALGDILETREVEKTN